MEDNIEVWHEGRGVHIVCDMDRPSLFTPFVEMEVEREYEFPGFAPFDGTNFTPMPNSWLEVLCKLDPSEAQVLLYVIRHTWGYQLKDGTREETKKISLDEFEHGRKREDETRIDSGTNLSVATINRVLKKMVNGGYLVCDVDGDRFSKRRVPKNYGLRINGTHTMKADTQTDKFKSVKEKPVDLKTMSYDEYLQTPEWKKKREKALRFAGYRCQLCNDNERLNVHHRTYERRGHELMGDLTVLCQDCHTTFTYNRELAK